MISVSASPSYGGTVSGGNTYNVGDNIQISASPNPGWSFSGWSDGGASTHNITVLSGGGTYTATFTQNLPTAATITVQALPSNGGSVSGSGTYLVGSNVTLSATASNGWRFVAWSDGLTNNPRTVVVSSDGGTYTANFILPDTCPRLAISNVTIVVGKLFTLPLDGSDPSGLPLTYSVVSNSMNTLVTTLVRTNRSLRLQVSGKNITDVDIAGQIDLELFEHLTPKTTARIVSLVTSNFYNGLTFHRVMQNFMAQGGDPRGDGSGGAGVKFDDEFVFGLTFTGFGQLAMANSGFQTSGALGRDNNDSQFFITAPNLAVGGTLPPQHLNYRHTIFGQLTHGFDLFGQLMATPVDGNSRPLTPALITSATIITNTQSTVLYLTAPTNTGAATLTVQAQSSGGTTQVTFQVTIAANTVNDPPFFAPMPAALITSRNVAVSFPAVWYGGNTNNFGLWDADTGASVSDIQVSLYNGYWYLTPRSSFVGQANLLFSIYDDYDHNGDGVVGSQLGSDLRAVQEYDTQRVQLTVLSTQQLSSVMVMVSPSGGGSVTGSGQYLVGSNAMVRATPTSGWRFLNWNGTITNNPWTFTVGAGSTTCTANFARLSTVTVLGSPAGGGIVTGGGVYLSISNATLSATPASGWLFGAWNDGNTNAGRSIRVPASNITYTATFLRGIGAAVDATNLTWTTGGSAGWTVQSSTTHDGVAALKSGAVGVGQQTWFQATTNGPGSLMFWWKSSTSPANTLQFYINTQLVSQISGNAGWNQYVGYIGTSNQVTLKWVYNKNSSAVSGSDAGWVDQVNWMPCPYAEHVPLIFYQDPTGLLASWVIGTNASFQFARILANTGGWALKCVGDVDGDTVSDLLFQNAAGDAAGWFMNADGSTRSARYWFNLSGWDIKACGDYEGIGRGQLFFQNAAGVTAYWRLDTNGNYLAAVPVGVMPGWKLRGIGDLDGDGKAELFWQNTAGTVVIWFHNANGTIHGGTPFNTGDWALCGVADIDGDHVSDLIWQNSAGLTGGWFMNTNGTARAASYWWGTGAWKLKAAGR